MSSKTLGEWAESLAAGRGHSAIEWETAMQSAIRRGTLGFFVESTAPRIPRVLESELNGWLKLRNGESELDAPPLPRNKAPASFRRPASPATGRHASRSTIGRPNR